MSFNVRAGASCWGSSRKQPKISESNRLHLDLTDAKATPDRKVLKTKPKTKMKRDKRDRRPSHSHISGGGPPIVDFLEDEIPICKPDDAPPLMVVPMPPASSRLDSSKITLVGHNLKRKNNVRNTWSSYKSLIRNITITSEPKIFSQFDCTSCHQFA